MERVAFLIEPSQERIGCLLNPESVVMKRAAGIRPAGSGAGRFTGIQLADDPLLFTGGGRTTLELDLLFDVSLAGSTIETSDVRDLTRPIWDLAENHGGPDGYGQPRLARFVWGKAWNLLGVVTEVAERLEQFAADGTPTRSWLRLRMRRVGRPSDDDSSEGAQPGWNPEDLSTSPPVTDNDSAYQVSGGGEEAAGQPASPAGSERLDDIAARSYGGRCDLWRWIANANGIDDPPWAPPGQVLRLPPAPTGSA